MKLGFLSDLHLDNNQDHFEENLLDVLIKQLQNQALDYLLISGDMSSDAAETCRMVQKMNDEMNTKTRFVPGNHDVWRQDKNSIDSLNNLNANQYSITDQALDINEEWTIVGAFPWYDYTLETEGKSQDFYHESDLWPDSKFTDWQMSDPDFSALQLEKTNQIIQRIPSYKNIILVQHFVPHKDYVIEKDNNRDWNLRNAFMGTKGISDLCAAYPNIKIATFGHIHHRFGIMEKFNTTFICNPLGYTHEWNTRNFKKEIEACLTVKTI